MAVGRSIFAGLAVLLAVALLALVASSCGGGQTPQAGEAGLKALAAQAAKGVIAKTTYRVSSNVDGQAVEGEWVIVQRPPDSRLEILNMEGGVESRTIIITSGGKSYLCVSAGGEENCLATSAQGTEAQTALLGPLFDIPQALAQEAEDVDLVETSQRQIAGLDATCFTIAGGPVDIGEGDICFSDGGLLLFVQSEVDGTSSTFEATSVSTEVSDADFEPPYEILELPEFEIPTPP